MIKAADPKPLIPAAAYCRMSSKKQGEKSIDEQRVEIAKLAAREGYHVADSAWYEDKAITGDSNSDERPGLAALLAAAKAGTFKVVFAWHTNRISREDPMDALPTFNALRKAGVGLITCCENRIDLENFTGQLLLFINQKGNNDFLIELSAKSLRGKIAAAKAGKFCGGRTRYGLDRALFDADGNLVRRLQPGECVKIKGHHLRLVPTTDPQKLEAIHYAFHRMDTAAVGLRQLAREMNANGYPGPTGAGWSHQSVYDLLATVEFVGTARWGSSAKGKYHQAQGEDIMPVKNGQHTRSKPQADAIRVEGATVGLLAADLFARIQRKLQRAERRRPAAKARYPLSGLIFCEHCGLPMEGSTRRLTDHKGNRDAYTYHIYLCKTYSQFGRDGTHNTTCGRHTIDARRILAWLVYKLQEVYLGPGRDALVQEIKKGLQREKKAPRSDVEQLQKRSADLDKQVGRLVKAIRTIDAAELVEQLAIVKAEQDRVKAEITQASKLTTVADIDEEAERVADSLVDLGERLATTKDPAVLREMLHQFVDKIVCRWEVVPGRLHGTHRFVDGDVVLSEQGGFSVLQVVDASSGPPTHRKASAGSGRWATTGPKSRLWLAPA